MSVCDSCRMAAHDELNEFGIDEDEAEEMASLIMVELGAYLADHICDQVESGGEIHCDCHCRRR